MVSVKNYSFMTNEAVGGIAQNDGGRLENDWERRPRDNLQGCINLVGNVCRKRIGERSTVDNGSIGGRCICPVELETLWLNRVEKRSVLPVLCFETGKGREGEVVVKFGRR